MADRHLVEVRQRLEQRQVLEIEIVAGVHADAKLEREVRRSGVLREARRRGVRARARTPARTARYTTPRDPRPSSFAQRIAAGSGSTNRLTRTPAAFKRADDAGKRVGRRIGRPSGFARDLARLHRHERALIGFHGEHQIEEPGARIAFDVEFDAALERRRARRRSRARPAVVMCRASARGCTVIPGAPASMHVRTASMTDGSWPPRELRTVATLFTLTDELDCSTVD